MQSSDDKLYTLDDLHKRLGKPPADLLDTIAPAEAREALIELGRHIKSERILTDAARIYGLAYAVWSKSSTTEKDALIGFSEDLLGLAVDRAIALRDPVSRADDAEHADASKLVSRANEATTAFQHGVVQRDRAYAG